MAIRITTRRRTVSEDNLIEKDGIMISTPQVEGFDEVYKRNYTRLSQYAFHIIHDKGDAEDLANEAFLVYYQHTDEINVIKFARKTLNHLWWWLSVFISAQGDI